MQSGRETRLALDHVGWEVRWPASIRSDPEAMIVGSYSPYRLVVRFDTNRGKPTSVMTHRAGAQGAFTGRWPGVELLPAPEGSSGSYPSGTPALVPLTTASDAGSGAG